MEVIPDRIYMSITINEKDSKGKIVLAQSEKKMIAKLKVLGVDTKKYLSVQDKSSNFKNYWIKSAEIMTSKEYQLLVTTEQMAVSVLQELEKIGISGQCKVRVELKYGIQPLKITGKSNNVVNSV